MNEPRPLRDRRTRDLARRLLSDGETLTAIGGRVGASRQTIAKLRDGRIYKRDAKAGG